MLTCLDKRGRFTARGIVALVFSCVSGILGVAVVAWYGFAEQERHGVGAGQGQDGVVEPKGPASVGESDGAARTEGVTATTGVVGEQGVARGG
jgi:iron transport multicopper oxidase